MNPAVKVVADIPGRGRGLVAARAIKPGEVLLADSPILLYPALDPPFSCTFCALCYRTLPAAASPFPSCPSCSGQARFCGEPCRATALASCHTPWACQALSRIRSMAAAPLPPPLDGPDALTQAAFLAAAYNLAAVSPDAFLRLLSLHGGAADHPAPALPLALHALIGSLSPPVGAAGFSPELTSALLSKDRMNAFGLMEPGSTNRRVRAYGIYPNASLFNHDCLPNACRFDYVDSAGDRRNTDIIARAIHEIPAGRELCLSYFPVNWGFRERQRRLLEDYGFSCACDRCSVEKDWKDDEVEDEGEVQQNEEMESMEEEDDGERGMEEEDEDERGMEEDEEEGDFPHAYFFVRFMCQREGCGGTLAPLPPSQDGAVSPAMECNACGALREADDSAGDGDDGIVVDG